MIAVALTMTVADTVPRSHVVTGNDDTSMRPRTMCALTVVIADLLIDARAFVDHYDARKIRCAQSEGAW